GLGRRFAGEALFDLGHDRGQISFLHTAQRGQRNESESTRKPRRRGYLPDAQDPVSQGRIERLTGETTLVEAGELSRIRTAVQQDQQSAYRQDMPLEQGAIIQQKVGQLGEGIVARLKVDRQ